MEKLGFWPIRAPVSTVKFWPDNFFIELFLLLLRWICVVNMCSHQWSWPLLVFMLRLALHIRVVICRVRPALHSCPVPILLYQETPQTDYHAILIRFYQCINLLVSRYINVIIDLKDVLHFRTISL